MLSLSDRVYILRNPVVGVRFLPEGPGIMRIVTHEEERRYLAAANSLLRDVATLILATGMRPEEVYTIRKDNVHLSQRYLFVPIGKTPLARRNVPLPDQALRHVEAETGQGEGALSLPASE